jgi:Flp pilus assembly pilin Flp
MLYMPQAQRTTAGLCIWFPNRRKKMKSLVMRLWHDEAGQDLTEYALLMVLIALASIVAMKGLATAISNVYGNAAQNLSTAT